MPKSVHRMHTMSYMKENPDSFIVHKEPYFENTKRWEVWCYNAGLYEDNQILGSFRTHAEALAFAIKKAGL